MLSNSTANRSFRDEVDTTINRETLSLANDAWIQFLLDHRSMIIEHSKLVEISQETLYRYRYRIRDYLKEVHSDNYGLDQIFRIINRLYNDLDFNLTLTHVYVPDTQYCLNLRKKYQTAQAKQKKI